MAKNNAKNKASKNNNKHSKFQLQFSDLSTDLTSLLTMAIAGGAEIERFERGNGVLNEWDKMTFNNYNYLLDSLDNPDLIPPLLKEEKTIIDWLAAIFPTKPYTSAMQYTNIDGINKVTMAFSCQKFSSTSHMHNIYDRISNYNDPTKSDYLIPNGGFQKVIFNILRNNQIDINTKILQFHWELFKVKHSYILYAMNKINSYINIIDENSTLFKKAMEYIINPKSNKDGGPDFSFNEFETLFFIYKDKLEIFPVNKLSELCETYIIEFLPTKNNLPHVEVDLIDHLIDTKQIQPNNIDGVEVEATIVVQGLSRGNPHIVSSCGGCSYSISKYREKGYDIQYHAFSTIIPEKTYVFKDEYTIYDIPEMLKDPFIKKLLNLNNFPRYVNYKEDIVRHEKKNGMSVYTPKTLFIEIKYLESLYIFQEKIKYFQEKLKYEVLCESITQEITSHFELAIKIFNDFKRPLTSTKEFYKINQIIQHSQNKLSAQIGKIAADKFIEELYNEINGVRDKINDLYNTESLIVDTSKLDAEIIKQATNNIVFSSIDPIMPTPCKVNLFAAAFYTQEYIDELIGKSREYKNYLLFQGNEERSLLYNKVDLDIISTDNEINHDNVAKFALNKLKEEFMLIQQANSEGGNKLLKETHLNTISHDVFNKIFKYIETHLTKHNTELSKWWEDFQIYFESSTSDSLSHTIDIAFKEIYNRGGGDLTNNIASLIDNLNYFVSSLSGDNINSE